MRYGNTKSQHLFKKQPRFIGCSLLSLQAYSLICRIVVVIIIIMISIFVTQIGQNDCCIHVNLNY